MCPDQPGVKHRRRAAFEAAASTKLRLLRWRRVLRRAGQRLRGCVVSHDRRADTPLVLRPRKQLQLQKWTPPSRGLMSEATSTTHGPVRRGDGAQ